VIEVSKLGQARIAVPEREREGPTTTAMLPDYKLKVKVRPCPCLVVIMRTAADWMAEDPQALECLTVLLRSLLIWTKEGPAAVRAEALAKADAARNGDEGSASKPTDALSTAPADAAAGAGAKPAAAAPGTPLSATPAPLLASNSSLTFAPPLTGTKGSVVVRAAAPGASGRAVASAADLADDPAQFQQIKNVKLWTLEGVEMFNFKPKKVRLVSLASSRVGLGGRHYVVGMGMNAGRARCMGRGQGVKFLLSKGCIKSNTPTDIAAFIHHTPGLHKTMVGEYLGEGDEEIIPIMHAYVDQMDFTGLNFLPALRCAPPATTAEAKCRQRQIMRLT
jgi:hypothetical protein